MAVVTVQLGQCGNQIGVEFFNTILQDLHGSHRHHVSPRDNENYVQHATDRFFVESSRKSNAMSGQSASSSSGGSGSNSCSGGGGGDGCRSSSSSGGCTSGGGGSTAAASGGGGGGGGGDGCGILEARAVMVDMEAKVISQTCQQARRCGYWRYPADQQLCHQRGSGNNWANGFMSCGPQAEHDVMDMIQKEAEKCDSLGGFLCLMSVAGGTGSGVGAYLTQCLRDVYPSTFIMNQVIWPYHTGEVIVQNYNAVLTLSSLYRTSDGILLTSNDQLQDICTRRLHIKQVSFEDLNSVVADQLTSLLQPIYRPKSRHVVYNCLGDMLQCLCPQPDYKLLSVKKTPQVSETVAQYNAHTWPGLLKHLRQMHIADSATDEGINWSVSVTDRGHSPVGSTPARHNRALSSLLMLRGEQLPSADTSAFKDPRLYCGWAAPQSSFFEWHQPRSFQHYDKSATLVSNCQRVATPLEHVVSRAWHMFNAKAFCHQYTHFGLSTADFLDAFACTEQIIANYTGL